MGDLPSKSAELVELAPFTVKRRTGSDPVRPPDNLGSHLVLRPGGVDYVDAVTENSAEVHFERHEGLERPEHAAFQHAVCVRLFGPYRHEVTELGPPRNIRSGTAQAILQLLHGPPALYEPLVEKPLRDGGPEPGRKVDERPGRRGNEHPAPSADVLLSQIGAPVHRDAGRSGMNLAGRRQLAGPTAKAAATICSPDESATPDTA